MCFPYTATCYEVSRNSKLSPKPVIFWSTEKPVFVFCPYTSSHPLLWSSHSPHYTGEKPLTENSAPCYADLSSAVIHNSYLVIFQVRLQSCSAFCQVLWILCHLLSCNSYQLCKPTKQVLILAFTDGRGVQLHILCFQNPPHVIQNILQYSVAISLLMLQMHCLEESNLAGWKLYCALTSNL